jgi:hypothetical protein
MRRLLTLLLTVVLGLGPTLEAIPAMASSLGLGSSASASIDEASLPACCRRNGTHHCALQAASLAAKRSAATAGSSAQSTGSTPALSAPDFCSRMPRALASTVTPWSALVSAGLGQSGPLAEPAAQKSRPTVAIAGQKRTQHQRGPPSRNL